MIDNQFGRRNLSSFQRASLALEMKPMLAEIAKVNQQCGQGGVLLLQKSAKANESLDTRKELAKEAGVSHDTISKVEKILVRVTEVRKEVRTQNRITQRITQRKAKYSGWY